MRLWHAAGIRPVITRSTVCLAHRYQVTSRLSSVPLCSSIRQHSTQVGSENALDSTSDSPSDNVAFNPKDDADRGEAQFQIEERRIKEQADGDLESLGDNATKRVDTRSAHRARSVARKKSGTIVIRKIPFPKQEKMRKRHLRRTRQSLGGEKTLAPKDEGDKTLAQKDEGDKTLAPKDEGDKTLAPKDEGDKTLAPKDEGDKTLAQKDEGDKTIGAQESAKKNKKQKEKRTKNAFTGPEGKSPPGRKEKRFPIPWHTLLRNLGEGKGSRQETSSQEETAPQEKRSPQHKKSPQEKKIAQVKVATNGHVPKTATETSAQKAAPAKGLYIQKYFSNHRFTSHANQTSLFRPIQKDSEETSTPGAMSLAEAMQGKPLEKSPPKPRDRFDPVNRPVALSKNINSLDASDLSLTPLAVDQPPVPRLFHGLDRVLFNQGVYQLQDPHTLVYNFEPYLQKIMPVAEFDYGALAEYKTSSQDNTLSAIAKEHNLRYVGSTSSMTSTLAHFHYLLSNWRPLNLDMLSRSFPETASTSFSQLQTAPNAIFLRWKNGTYAIDADKQYDGANVLMLLGKSLEKLLTMSPDSFERYRKSDPRQISEAERNSPESFHYSSQGDFLMRSQLDAYDPRLPGTGMFDLKTRAVVSVRMQSDDYEEMSGYEVHKHHGDFESFEREYYDMLRSTMLKYSLQVRMGRMDGIFVAYHNVKRMFGFQYLNLGEMDRALHGQTDRCLGNQEFSLSIEMLNKIVNMATERFPKQSLRFHFETRPSKNLPFMYIFAEPMSEEAIDTIQSSQKEKIKAFERSIMGPTDEVEESASEMAESAQKLEESASEVDEPAQEDPISDTVKIESGTVKVVDPETSELVVESDLDLAAVETTRAEAAAASTTTTIEKGAIAMMTRIPSDTTTSPSFFSTDLEIKTGTLQIIPPLSSPPPTDPTAFVSLIPPSKTPPKKKQDREDAPTSPLLALMLTTRSLVNDRYVDRPTSLSPSDSWNLEYTLSEIPQPRRKWELYDATRARRHKAQTRNRPVDSNEEGEKGNEKKRPYDDFYIERLRRLSEKGRALRRSIDESERGREKIVFGRPFEREAEGEDESETPNQGKGEEKGEEEEEEEDVKIDGVNDYTEWLFQRRGDELMEQRDGNGDGEEKSVDVNGVDDYMRWLYRGANSRK